MPSAFESVLKNSNMVYHPLGAAPASQAPIRVASVFTRARQLIQQTNRSVTEIAVATGFVSSPQFQRRFRNFLVYCLVVIVRHLHASKLRASRLVGVSPLSLY